MKRTLALAAAVAAFSITTPAVASAAPVLAPVSQEQVQGPTVSFSEPVWDETRGTYSITATLQGQPGVSYPLTITNGDKAPQNITMTTSGGGTITIGKRVAPGAVFAISTGGQVVGSVTAPLAPVKNDRLVPTIALSFLDDARGAEVQCVLWVQVENATPGATDMIVTGPTGTRTVPITINGGGYTVRPGVERIRIGESVTVTVDGATATTTAVAPNCY